MYHDHQKRFYDSFIGMTHSGIARNNFHEIHARFNVLFAHTKMGLCTNAYSVTEKEEKKSTGRGESAELRESSKRG